MKKILVTLLVLALCAPAMAATVVFDDGTPGDGIGTFTVNAAGAVNIVGMGLNVDVTAGGNIIAATVDTPTFNIHPDYANGVGAGYAYGTGTPIADQDALGWQDPITNSFAISVGALNGAATPGAAGAASVVITVTVDATTTVSIEENALRGGIVLTDGNGEDIDGTTVSGEITVGGGAPCGGGGDAGFDAEYAAAVAAGLDPSCWCDARQCRGDADNAVEGKANAYCAAGDLTILLSAWNKDINSIAGTDICADFDRLSEGKLAVRVASADLTVLLANWNLSLDTNPPAACALTTGVQP